MENMWGSSRSSSTYQHYSYPSSSLQVQSPNPLWILHQRRLPKKTRFNCENLSMSVFDSNNKEWQIGSLRVLGSAEVTLHVDSFKLTV